MEFSRHETTPPASISIKKTASLPSMLRGLGILDDDVSALRTPYSDDDGFDSSRLSRLLALIAGSVDLEL